ncbi:hypothetical protein ED236_12305, partial [Pseudomethylobacillus aquaticus]
GWTKTTTQADGYTLIDQLDMFGRVTWHQDLGEHQFVYTYNHAGWLTSQTSLTGANAVNNSGQHIAYTHYANGYVQSIHDKALGMYTYYAYDANGNKTYEGYLRLKHPLDLSLGAMDYYQTSTIKYDSHNRIMDVLDPKVNLHYEYDAVGNRRMVKSVYHDGVNGTQRTQEYWYQYDSMDRFTVTMGQLGAVNNGVFTASGRATTATDTSIVIDKGVSGGDGVAISYNLVGDRMEVSNARDNSRERYTYTADGYLEEVRINNVLRSRRVNDALGRVTAYHEYASNGTTVKYTQATTYDADSRLLREEGTGGTTTYEYYVHKTNLNPDGTASYSATGRGVLAHTNNDANGNQSGGTLTDTYYGYAYWDDAKVTAIQSEAYNKDIGKNNRLWKPGYSDITFDVNGRASTAVDRVGNRNIQYVSDAQGQILLRDELTGTIERPTYTTDDYNPGTVANKVARYYYVDGKRVGGVSNDGPSWMGYLEALRARKDQKPSNHANWRPVGSADFSQGYDPISPVYPGKTGTQYTVQEG